jgi:hypothetical protein
MSEDKTTGLAAKLRAEMDDDAAWRALSGIAEQQASEIDRLLALLRRYRTETPLGHQPRMIAHEVDEVLNVTR